MSQETRFSVLVTVLLFTPIVLVPAMSMDVYVPSVPRMMTLLHTSQAKIQLTLSVFMFGMSVGQLLIGPMADHWGRKIVLLSSLILYTFATLACALANQVEWLIFYRLLQSIGACGCIVTAWASVRDMYTVEESAAVYSYLSGAIGLAPILAPILGGYLLLWSNSWRSGFFFCVFWGIFCLGVVIWGWRETLTQRVHLALDRSVFSHYGHILSREEFWRYTFGASMGMSALFLFFSISPILLIEHLGVAEHHFGYYFGLAACVYFSVNMICPKIQKAIGNLNTLRLASIFFILGPAAMIAWHSVWGLSPMGVVMPTLLLYVGVGLIFGPCTAGALGPFPGMAGTAAALFGAVEFGIPFVLGLIIMQWPVTSMLSFALPMLALGIVALIWTFSIRKKTAH